MKMDVAGHLRIDVGDYDALIRTFVPHYEELIVGAAAGLDLVPIPTPTVIDMGTGTGALAAACLAVRPGARLIGIDSDSGMLEVARARLAGISGVQLVATDFMQAPLPSCDALVACLALHHIRSAARKRVFYARCRAALSPSGILVSADCFPGKDERVAARHRRAWLEHLERTYTRAEAEDHLRSWSEEDVYFALEDEFDWLRAAGFQPEVLWRTDGFAVVAAFPSVSEG